MNYEEEITTMVSEFNEQKKLFTEKSKMLLNQVFADFLTKHPEVEAVVWTQYTPYFNDGDECTFSISELTYTNSKNGAEISYGEYCGDSESIWATESGCAEDQITDELCAAIDSFDSAVTSIDDSVFKDIFGNHVEIIATSSGFDVSEYEHE